MSKKPKPPAGFVPVDSEEARKIDGHTFVNYATVWKGRWHLGCLDMNEVRDAHETEPRLHYHVQLPPPSSGKRCGGGESSITQCSY